MNHAKAMEIAEAYKPNLHVDPQNTALPAMFVVRRKIADNEPAPPIWTPFSIHLPTDPSPDDEDAAAREEVAFKASLDAADAALLPAVASADPA